MIAAVAAVATVIAADVLHADSPGVLPTIGHVGLVAVPVLAAEALRARRSHVAELRDRLALAEQAREQEARPRVEHERLRIARDLHDVVAHTLTTINVQAATAAQVLDRNPWFARSALETIEDASRNAIAGLRAILGVLRERDEPEALRTPAPGIANVTDLVQRARDAGLDAHLQISGRRLDRLSDAVSLAAYRTGSCRNR